MQYTITRRRKKEANVYNKSERVNRKLKKLTNDERSCESNEEF